MNGNSFGTHRNLDNKRLEVEAEVEDTLPQHAIVPKVDTVEQISLGC